MQYVGHLDNDVAAKFTEELSQLCNEALYPNLDVIGGLRTLNLVLAAAEKDGTSIGDIDGQSHVRLICSNMWLLYSSDIRLFLSTFWLTNKLGSQSHNPLLGLWYSMPPRSPTLRT